MHGLSFASDLNWAVVAGRQGAKLDACGVWVLLLIRLLAGRTGGRRKIPYCGPCAQWASVLEKLTVVGSWHTDAGARDQGAQEADGH